MKADEFIERHADDGPSRLFLEFTGMVQGVGFRWTMQDLARKAGVVGWVCNMDDGSVHCELEGTGATICQVIAAIRDQYAQARTYAFLRRMGYSFEITRCEERPCLGEQGEGDFRVTF